MPQTNRIPASVQLLFMNLFTSGIHARLPAGTGVQRTYSGVCVSGDVTVYSLATQRCEASDSKCWLAIVRSVRLPRELVYSRLNSSRCRNTFSHRFYSPLRPISWKNKSSDWLRLNVPPTQYRSWGRVFTGQMTQPTVSKHWRNTQN